MRGARRTIGRTAPPRARYGEVETRETAPRGGQPRRRRRCAGRRACGTRAVCEQHGSIRATSGPCTRRPDYRRRDPRPRTRRRSTHRARNASTRVKSSAIVSARPRTRAPPRRTGAVRPVYPPLERGGQRLRLRRRYRRVLAPVQQQHGGSRSRPRGRSVTGRGRCRPPRGAAPRAEGCRWTRSGAWLRRGPDRTRDSGRPPPARGRGAPPGDEQHRHPPALPPDRDARASGPPFLHGVADPGGDVGDVPGPPEARQRLRVRRGRSPWSPGSRAATPPNRSARTPGPAAPSRRATGWSAPVHHHEERPGSSPGRRHVGPAPEQSAHS